MKIIVSQSDLATALAAVARAVPSRPSHPVLACVLVTADQSSQTVAIRAYDLQIGIETVISAQVDFGGEAAIPAKTLTDIVSRLSDGELTIVVSEEWDDADGDEEKTAYGQVVITSTSGRYKLRGMLPDDFPALPTVDDGESLTLSVEELAAGVGSVSFAASTEETKQILTGVHIQRTPSGHEYAATDGHRLAVHGSIEPIAGGVVIPRRACDELVKRLAVMRPEDDAHILLTTSQALFKLGSYSLYSRIIEGAFPNYSQLVPRQFMATITIDRRGFLAAVGRVGVLADTRNNVIKVAPNAKEQTVTLSVESQDVGSGREVLSATIDGDATPFALNLKYALDPVKSLTSGEITLHINGTTQPILIKPLSGAPITHLVMPVQLRD